MGSENEIIKKSKMFEGSNIGQNIIVRQIKFSLIVSFYFYDFVFLLLVFFNSDQNYSDLITF